MAHIGRYCKAYPIGTLSRFPGWSVKHENLRPKKSANSAEQKTQRELAEDDYFFVHDNFIVTDGIFFDQHIVFDEVTEEWKNFCIHDLNFQVPAEPERELATANS